MNAAFVCTVCKKEYGLSSPRWRCDCGGLLDILFQPKIDPKQVSARRPNLWRYREAIPWRREPK